MKWLILNVFLFLPIAANAATAHDYYNQIYQAGRLDSQSSDYACFNDDANLTNFFVFSDSEALKDSLIDAGIFSKLTVYHQKILNNGFLTTRLYNKGIPSSYRDSYNKDDDTWLTESDVIDKHFAVRLRLKIEWSTMRYRKTVETRMGKFGAWREAASSFGYCEKVPSLMQQKGKF